MTHILIPLDHDPFEVTEQSIENPPDWVGHIETWDECNPPVYSKTLDSLLPFGDYLVSYRGKIGVWSPEDVERYIKNPYEECAKVAEGLKACGCNGEHGPCLADDPYDHVAQAIRQLEQKEGK